MQIQDLVNESVGETEDNLNRRLLGNHKEVNKEFYRKKDSLVGLFPPILEFVFQ